MRHQNSDEATPVETIARLRREHRELDQKLQEMDQRRFLTPTEDMERKRLQKLKLLKKDKIFYLEKMQSSS